ncbi:MAG: GGDEF domain-containing protein [Chloroflexota bacterium]
MGVLKRLFSQIILHLGDIEDEYRREQLSVDKAQSVVTVLIVAVAMISMLWVDFILFKEIPRLFTWMLWYRGLYVFLALIIAWILCEVQLPKMLDRVVFAWSLITAIFLLLFNFTRPSNYLTTPFDILYPFAVYMLSPLRPRYNVLLAGSFSIATLVVDAFYKTGVSPIALPVAVSSQVLVHLLGLPSGIQIHSYRRKSFKAFLDQKDAREMANYLINIDGLTKCMTRLYFIEMAEKEFLRTKRYKLPLSLLMLDIDHFKRINDQYGHHIGDQALQRFAAVVLEQKRAQDIFGRLGGEEFGLLLPNTTLNNARLVAERIQQTWAFAPLTVASKTVRSTVSIGVVEVDPLDDTFGALLHRADNAMYKAKRRGRNRVAAG